MSFKHAVETIQSNSFVLVVLDIIFLFLPGIMVIYLYNNPLFLSLDWVKLVLLSAAFSAPFAVFNGIVISDVVGLGKEQKEAAAFREMTLGILLNGIVIYVMAGLVYLADGTFFDMLLAAIAVDALCIAALFVLKRSKLLM